VYDLHDSVRHPSGSWGLLNHFSDGVFSGDASFRWHDGIGKPTHDPAKIWFALLLTGEDRFAFFDR
jgi:hypothetical protein